MTPCLHCGSPIPPSLIDYCCPGCRAAHGLIEDQGLGAYYRRRCIDPAVRPLRPDDAAAAVDLAAESVTGADGTCTLHLMVEGLHCAACVWLIESLLARQEGVLTGRVNMTTHRLVLRWRGGRERAGALVAPVLAIGYRLAPFDPARLESATGQRERELLRALAVAGFAAANVMLFSVSVWAGVDMGPATRGLMHWLSALIAVPALLYAVRPFARSAVTALRALRTNMDVPITLAVVLATGMSLVETVTGGPHAYFDSAITLLFFLLIGRYLESRARGRARSAAEHLLALGATAVMVVDANGTCRPRPPRTVAVGATVLVAAGERIGVDGTVVEGRSDLDTSLMTGETLPMPVSPGERVFAGNLNLSAPVRLTVTAVGDDTLLAEIVRLMEAAEQGRARMVALADRVARLYAPVVHGMALFAFLGWTLVGGLAWQPALMIAIAVLIVTCPCALALAVPVVQVLASSRLLSRGILLTSATALERLHDVTTVVFDKTGTLTLGHPDLVRETADGTVTIDDADLAAAAPLAATSRHPLAKALVRAAPPVAPAAGVIEEPGCGLSRSGPEGEARLGSRAWCGVADDPDPRPAAGLSESGPELWFVRPHRAPVRFAFRDALRPDARETVAALRRRGLSVELLSGDRASVVAEVATALGIDTWRAGCSPADKAARLAELDRRGERVCMVGDGLNDAPALAAARVSLSPATAADVTRTAADVIFQGDRLAPVVESLDIAIRADRLVRQNFAIALLYNVITVPLAMAGLVTPLVAAVAMSTSSIAVIANAVRSLRRGG